MTRRALRLGRETSSGWRPNKIYGGPVGWAAGDDLSLLFCRRWAPLFYLGRAGQRSTVFAPLLCCFYAAAVASVYICRWVRQLRGRKTFYSGRQDRMRCLRHVCGRPKSRRSIRARYCRGNTALFYWWGDLLFEVAGSGAAGRAFGPLRTSGAGGPAAQFEGE